MGFFLESYDRPLKSHIAANDVHVGEIVADNGSDKATPFDHSSHGEDDLLGVADRLHAGDHVAFDVDDTDHDIYKSADDDRVPSGGDADRDVIKALTAEDTGGNEATPDITDGDVVGIVDTSAGSLSSTAEYKGRVVEEGYDDGESTPTTYNRSNNNFFALGVAHRDDVNAFDEPVRIEVRKDLN